MSGFRIRALVEDRAQESSLRGLLDRHNRARDLRVEPYPSGRGAAEQFVRAQFPRFVREIRAQRHQFNLWGVVVIDGDVEGFTQRRRRLLESLSQDGTAPVTAEDRVVVMVPTRNIETWAWHLLGNEVDERTDYKARVIEPIRGIFARQWSSVRSNEPPSLGDGRIGWARVDS
ncbi:MAG: hypothetical protein DI536_22285 [Archangium gephyra]|uniref:DUF4276 family protein n=1 Tax=Archangium gephyra TaxID=48 RepID=A0A2W5T8I6_9BACT|nr:MAG: hypothetical protein DI536_22285 [Archangium gephyra]